MFFLHGLRCISSWLTKCCTLLTQQSFKLTKDNPCAYPTRCLYVMEPKKNRTKLVEQFLRHTRYTVTHSGIYELNISLTKCANFTEPLPSEYCEQVNIMNLRFRQHSGNKLLVLFSIMMSTIKLYVWYTAGKCVHVHGLIVIHM